MDLLTSSAVDDLKTKLVKKRADIAEKKKILEKQKETKKAIHELEESNAKLEREVQQNKLKYEEKEKIKKLLADLEEEEKNIIDEIKPDDELEKVYFYLFTHHKNNLDIYFVLHISSILVCGYNNLILIDKLKEMFTVK